MAATKKDTPKSTTKKSNLKTPPTDAPEAPAATAADHQRARTGGKTETPKAGTARSAKSESSTARAKKPPVDPPEAPAATAEDHRRAMMGDRDQMIRQAAYYRAERRGFQGGDPEQDWLEAEAEVDREAQEHKQA